MAKEQRVVFVLKKNNQGKLSISMTFYPKLARTKELFDEMPMYMRELQTAAADVGKYVMEALAKKESDGSCKASDKNV